MTTKVTCLPKLAPYVYAVLKDNDIECEVIENRWLPDEYPIIVFGDMRSDIMSPTFSLEFDEIDPQVKAVLKHAFGREE